MGSNLLSSECVYCSGDIVLNDISCMSISDAIRAIKSHSKCRCADCGASYQLMSTNTCGFDLCFSSSGRDEPYPEDLPIWYIKRDEQGKIISKELANVCATCNQRLDTIGRCWGCHS